MSQPVSGGIRLLPAQAYTIRSATDELAEAIEQFEAVMSLAPSDGQRSVAMVGSFSIRMLMKTGEELAGYRQLAVRLGADRGAGDRGEQADHRRGPRAARGPAVRGRRARPKPPDR
jgi:hypothetical protein